MRYKDRDALVSGLRELADFVEEKGLELPIVSPDLKMSVWLHDDYGFSENRHKLTARQKMRRAAKLLGNAQKNWGSHYLDLRRKFSSAVTLEFVINRDQVCERRVVARKHVPEQVVPARIEEIVEWVCTDPILADATREEVA